jgi:hypothetical protein
MPDGDASPITVLRSDDLLLLRFHFHGLKLQVPTATGQTWKLVKNPANQVKPLIIVEFPPQSIGEESFFQVVDGVDPPSDQPYPPAGTPPDPDESEPLEQPQAHLSGPTWLVFNVANATPVTYTLPGLLAACVSGNLNVSIERREPMDALIRLDFNLAQGRLFTRIEAPYHLVLSPEINTTWRGQALPKANAADTRVELWHVAMLKSKNNPTPGGTVRAVWATDFTTSDWPADAPVHADDPFRMSLDKRDRYEIVRLTTDGMPNAAATYTAPVEVDQLILSTMGAWLKAAGAWDPPGTLSVAEWRHVMTMGRDHFVRVVYKGYLFPFGHEASLVKITERKIEAVPNGGGQRAAYLRTRMFVIVREPVHSYNHNGFPFTQVTLKTLITPGIDPPGQSQIAGYSQDAFWIRSGNKDVLFRVVARDHEGRNIEFVAPLAFVANNKATDSNAAADIANKAWSAPKAPSRKHTLGGQAVAFAPKANPNDTTLETESINLGAKGNDASTPRFLPLVIEAQVDIPAVKQLLGSAAQLSTITYEPTFTDAAPGKFNNPADIFARVTGTPNVAFSAEQAGGLVKPDFAIQGLSRSLGPVPQVNEMVLGDFNPTTVFPEVELLGGIKLNQIVNQVRFGGAPADGKYVPRLTPSVEDGAAVTRYRPVQT